MPKESKEPSRESSRGLHRWRFFRAGGFDQVRLDTTADLEALAELDQKLWVALSCPVHGLECDEKTLELIDTDKDGRIRAPEVLAAVKWACTVLKNPESLLKRSDKLPLSAIDTDNDEGKRLLASAKQILKNLGREGHKEIALEDTADTARIFAATPFNGDGIVPVESAGDPAIARVIEDIIACLGPAMDRGGAPGVSQEKVDQFFAEAEAFATWWAAAEADAANVLPLGERTPESAEALRAVKAKVDDYFARTRLVGFDARASGPLNRDEADYVALASKELTTSAPEVASFPLCHVEADKALSLKAGINPAWAEPMQRLCVQVIEPLLGPGKAELTEAEWREVSARLAGYEAWRGKRAGALVDKLGHDRIREILDRDLGAKARLDALIVEDKALEQEANSIDAVDRLIRYHRDLDALLNNFVTFRDFYSRKKKALFQAGTLYLDGRSCELCIKVKDPSAHALLATQSGTFLAYCDCTRKGTTDKMHIVAAITNGHAEALSVARNGIFYDRKGDDWDATVVRLIQHPISTREAFWSPYRRVAKLIGEQIEKFASSRDKEMHDKAATSIADTGKAASDPAAPAPVPVAVPVPAAPAPPATPDKPFEIGALAAISIAIGALGSAIAAVATGFLKLAWWQMPLVLVGLMLAVSGPSVILAWLKLHRRNIGPLLDANGWAVNAQAKLNIPFGESLTAVATLPPNAERSLDDPFAEPKPKWRRYVFAAVAALVLAAAWELGYLELGWEKLRAYHRAPPAAPAASASAAPAAAPPKK